MRDMLLGLTCSLFLSLDSWGKNIIIFGVENSSSVHIDNN